jgi:hypothetical protein
MLFEIGLKVVCSTGCSLRGTAALASLSGVPGMVMEKFNLRLVVRLVPLGRGWVGAM